MNSRRLMLLAGAVFLASWCVPVTIRSGELVGGTLWGWQAFIFALLSPAIGRDWDIGVLQTVWMVVSALSNFLAIAVALCDLRPSKRWLTRLAWALAGAFVLNTVWVVLPETRRGLQVGYFLWVSAFGVAALAAFWRVRAVGNGVGTP